MKRLKVLMCAYACDPAAGSEPGVGWSFAREASRFCDVWVLTRNNRPSIERRMAAEPANGLHFVYGREPLPRPLALGIRQRSHNLHYYLWSWANRDLVKSLHRAVGFDLGHHTTYGRYWTPSCLLAADIPLILGPAGGGESCPPDLSRQWQPRDRFKEWARDRSRTIGERDPLARSTLLRAAALLVTTRDTARRVRRLGGRPRLFPQVIFSQTDFDRLAALPPPPPGPIRFLSAGRHLHWKGFELGIRGFARMCSQAAGAEYWITGDGPQKPRLEAVARQLGCADRVRFTGSLGGLEQVYHILGQSHVLVHPSLHEAFGAICAEAQAAGRPVICLDTGGPAVIVSEQTGRRVALGSLEQVIDGIAAAMRGFAEQPQTILSMGHAAQQRAAQTLCWPALLATLRQIYEGAAVGDGLEM